MEVEVRDLKGGYGAELVIDGVSFRIDSGSVVTLLGPNGSGKSTLLKMLGRILKPRGGVVLLDGKDVFSLDPALLARRMAILPQLQQTPAEVTVEELVSLGRYPHRGWNFVASPRDREAVENALAMTRMADLRDRLVSSLSGGERQRAWIALTLAQEPEVLLLDEPTAFLDICCQFEIIDVVRTLNRERGTTVVMALHDLNLAASCSDRMILLKDRRIRCAGKPVEVMTSEILREVFEIETEVSMTARGVPFCAVLGSARRQGADDRRRSGYQRRDQEES